MTTNIALKYRIGTNNDLDKLQCLNIIAYSEFKNKLTPDNWEIFNGNLQDKQKLVDILKISTCFIY